MITRRGLHEEISRLDEIIDAANTQKAACFKEYREQLAEKKQTKGEIKTEIEAFKAAERKLRAVKKKGEDSIVTHETLVDEIIEEIQRPARSGTPVATRAGVTRESSSGGAESRSALNVRSQTPSGGISKEHAVVVKSDDAVFAASVDAPQVGVAPDPLEAKSTKEASATEFSEPAQQAPQPHVGQIDADAPFVDDSDGEPASGSPSALYGQRELAGDTSLIAGSPTIPLDAPIPEFCRGNPNDPVWRT